MPTIGQPGDPIEPVEVPLLLTGGSRWITAEPSRIAVGTLRMRSWQVFPVQPPPRVFDGHSAYLLKMNYDLMPEPDMPEPSWFEVGFDMSTGEGGEPVTVIDAIPRCVLQPQASTSYAIDGYLDFVAGSDVNLPAARPIVDMFGVGGPEVRWRHTSGDGAGRQLGSYTAWATIVAPRRCAELSVTVTARFDLPPDEAFGCRPTDEPATFVLRLVGSPPYRSPLAVHDEVSHLAARAPRVFVSYTHDDSAHKDAVLRFSTFLATTCGFDVHMDRWDLDRRRNWYQWAIEQVTKADFVLVIASPRCKQVADGHGDPKSNRGMQSEILLLMEQLHSDRETWSRKLLPVVLPGRSPDEIPLFLAPQTADHYLVQDFTVEGADDLLRAVTGQPAYLRPSVNPVVVRLPTRG